MPTSRRQFLTHTARSSAASFFLPSLLLGEKKEVSPLLKPSGPLVESLERVGRCCFAWLNAEQEHLPTGGYEIAHDVGRWWDAMLRLEAAIGTPIPAEAAMLRNLELLTDNPAGLLTNTARLPIPEDKLKVNPHNLRETFLAFYALIKWRPGTQGDTLARRQGQKLLVAIDQCLEADGQMNYEKLAQIVAGPPLTKDPLMVQRSPAGQWFNATGSSGRALEAILLFHEVTQEPLALQLSHRFAEIHFKQCIDSSGQIKAELLDPAHIGHTHSYLGTLRGLLLYGLVTDNPKYIDAVAATYRHGLFGKAISYSGWTPHDQGKIRFPDKEGDPLGEHASCGDVAQIALWLALRAGQTDLLDDVQRLIRARLLPSQTITPDNPRSDGSWGVYNHPFGRGNILDVFAAVLHSLADFHTHIITPPRTPGDPLTINLHFHHTSPDLTIEPVRTQTTATLRITPHRSHPLKIRIPTWAPKDTLKLEAITKDSSKSTPFPITWQGPHLHIAPSQIPPGSILILTHTLPKRQTLEVMPISHRPFHLTWHGDQVTTCSPKVAIYP